MSKRNLFEELKEGFDVLEAERAGKLTLRQTVVDYRSMPKLPSCSAWWSAIHNCWMK